MKIGLPLDMCQICPTIKATYYKVSAANMVNSAHYPHGGVLIITEVHRKYVIVASRGRNPDHPSNRDRGQITAQRLEPNLCGMSNTITSVQKDNLLLEVSYEQEGLEITVSL